MENRRRAQDIPRRSELDDEDVLFDRIIVRATIAVDAFLLVGAARNIATKVAAIGVVQKRVQSAGKS